MLILDVPHSEISQWTSAGSNAAAAGGDDRPKSQVVRQVSFCDKNNDNTNELG